MCRIPSARVRRQVGALADYQQLATFIFGALWAFLFFVAGIVMAATGTGRVVALGHRCRALGAH